MNKEDSEIIINYVVTITKPLWKKWTNQRYSDLDTIFLKIAYEQGGFSAPAFYNLLQERGIGTIDDLGRILENYQGNLKYSRIDKGSLESPFYLDLKNGVHGEPGKTFFKCTEGFLNEKLGNPGGFFWVKLWQMLVCSRKLRQEYQSSFKFYLKKKYYDFISKPIMSDEDFCIIGLTDWERFKKEATPWNELYGIGDNVFDYLVRDIKEFRFSRDAFKFDSTNRHFFRVTGISTLFNLGNKESAIKFLKELRLENAYTLKEVNTGIYAYCSEKEKKIFGFCRDLKKCVECGVNAICEKNI
jgi:hypothetical protein